MMHRRFQAVVVLLVLVLAVPFARAQASYRYAVTPVLTGNFEYASSFAINSQGDMVGTVYQGGDDRYGVLYAGGVATRLGTLGGIASTAYGINDNGVVVGYSTNADGLYHATMYRNGAVTDLTPGYASETSAFGINNAGVAVGAIQCNCSIDTRAAIFHDGQISTLGTVGGHFAGALDINNSGAIVGWSSDAEGQDHAFLYRGGTLTDLGTFGGRVAEARAINDAGDVIGTIQFGEPIDERGYFWRNGNATLLGSLPGYGSEALGLNGLGQVVGALYGVDWQHDAHGFIWENGQLVTLDSLIDPAQGWTITQAGAINDAGQIAATGCNAALGVCGLLRLDQVSPVPEPASFAMLAGGLAVLARRRRRERPIATSS